MHAVYEMLGRLPDTKGAVSLFFKSHCAIWVPIERRTYRNKKENELRDGEWKSSDEVFLRSGRAQLWEFVSSTYRFLDVTYDIELKDFFHAKAGVSTTHAISALPELLEGLLKTAYQLRTKPHSISTFHWHKEAPILLDTTKAHEMLLGHLRDLARRIANEELLLQEEAKLAQKLRSCRIWPSALVNPQTRMCHYFDLQTCRPFVDDIIPQHATLDPRFALTAMRLPQETTNEKPIVLVGGGQPSGYGDRCDPSLWPLLGALHVPCLSDAARTDVECDDLATRLSYMRLDRFLDETGSASDVPISPLSPVDVTELLGQHAVGFLLYWAERWLRGQTTILARLFGDPQTAMERLRLHLVNCGVLRREMTASEDDVDPSETFSACRVTFQLRVATTLVIEDTVLASWDAHSSLNPDTCCFLVRVPGEWDQSLMHTTGGGKQIAPCVEYVALAAVAMVVDKLEKASEGQRQGSLRDLQEFLVGYVVPPLCIQLEGWVLGTFGDVGVEHAAAVARVLSGEGAEWDVTTWKQQLQILTAQINSGIEKRAAPLPLPRHADCESEWFALPPGPSPTHVPPALSAYASLLAAHLETHRPEEDTEGMAAQPAETAQDVAVAALDQATTEQADHSVHVKQPSQALDAASEELPDDFDPFAAPAKKTEGRKKEVWPPLPPGFGEREAIGGSERKEGEEMSETIYGMAIAAGVDFSGTRTHYGEAGASHGDAHSRGHVHEDNSENRGRPHPDKGATHDGGLVDGGYRPVDPERPPADPDRSLLSSVQEEHFLDKEKMEAEQSQRRSANEPTQSLQVELPQSASLPATPEPRPAVPPESSQEDENKEDDVAAVQQGAQPVVILMDANAVAGFLPLHHVAADTAHSHGGLPRIRSFLHPRERRQKGSARGDGVPEEKAIRLTDELLEEMMRVGRIGEGIVCEHLRLEETAKGGDPKRIVWVNEDSERGLPYDIVRARVPIHSPGDLTEDVLRDADIIEVKSSLTDDSAVVYLTLNELRLAQQIRHKYFIYRVIGLHVSDGAVAGSSENSDVDSKVRANLSVCVDPVGKIEAGEMKLLLYTGYDA